MDDDTQQLVYKINVITEGVQGKVADVTNELNRVKTTVDAIGKSQLQVNTTKALDEFESLNSMLREVRRGIELLTRNNNAQIIDLNGIPQTMTSLRLLEMQIQDLQKSIKAASLNEIFKSNQKQQIAEVTSALQSQRKAVDDLNKSMEQQKAISQSTYYRRRNDFDSANTTLGNYNVAPKDNPYGGSWSDYVKQVQNAGSMRERIEKNIAESQTARQARSTAELNNSKQLIQLRNQLQNAENAQNAAIARGNQLEVQRYETLRQQYATAKQALEARGERVTTAEPMAASQYATAESFNRQAMIDSNMAWRNREISSYTNEVGKLQRAQESLYAIYKQDPSQQNLANFSATTARLKEVSEQYRVYQRSIQNTGSTMDQFMVKARSHLAWIASGFTIGALFAIPTETVDTMERIESEMASIKQVMPEIEGKDDSSIAKYNSEMQEFIGIASQYGEAVDKVMDAARSIGRMYGQGDNGIANTNLMTQQAAKMATADAFDMTTATKALESAMAQWGLQTQDTNQLMVNSNRILDTWTITAHRGAASAQDIGNAIEAAGTAAAQAGVSFEFFNALVETGVRSTGKSGSEIGQAIKSMMVSMQTDKSAKALKEWGIALDEVGEDGVKRMRSMEDVILDVSMAINSTNKDPSKLLMTLSGGKYQYSKVSTMLKDYQELLRMMGVINSDDTVGFTTKQVEVQMDTLKRKMQTIKDDLQSGIMGIGANGGLDALKSIADHIDNIINAFNKMDSTGISVMSKIVVGALALKGFDKFARSIMTTVQSYKMLSKQSEINQANDTKESITKQWLNQRYVENTKVAAAARLAKQGYVIESTQESAADTVVAATKNVETEAQVRNTATKGAATVATRVLVVAEGALATATRAASLAMASFGGPIGLAITALSILIPMELMEADANGEQINAHKNLNDKIDESIAKNEELANQAERQGEVSIKLANQYNSVKESMGKCTEGSKEYNKKNIELADTEKTIEKILGEGAVQFDENGKIKVSSIKEVADKKKEKAIQNARNDAAEAEANRDATQAELNNASKRLASLEEEAKGVYSLGKAWNWLYKIIGDVYTHEADVYDQKMKEANERRGTWLGFGDDTALWARTKLDSWIIGVDSENFSASAREAANKYYGKAGELGAEEISSEISSAKNNVESLKSQLESDNNKVSDIYTRIEAMSKPGSDGNNPDITKRGESDDNDYGKSKEPKSPKQPKAQPWEYGDEASRAMYAVTQQSSIFDKYGVDMSRLMAIASRITGAQGFDFAGTPDIFGMGAANPWDSAYAFATKLNELLSTGKEDLDTALQAITGMDGWDGYLENEKTYLDKSIDFKKHARRFADPYNDTSGGIPQEVIAAAEKYGVDKTLALQVAQHESGFKQDSVSKAGAIGVMQLMPGTASGLGVDPYNEAQNIDGGIRYLKQQLDAFGDTRTALAAYNAGPGNTSAGMGYADEVLAEDVSNAVQSGVSAAMDGEGTTWVKQGDWVSMDGTLPQTQQALEALAKWYKEQTGNPLVLAAGTNGTHQSDDSPTGHKAGYKVDVNSFLDGVDGALETNADLRKKFREYGESLGLGMSEEGSHIDVQTTGYEWTTGANYGGFHAPAQQQSDRWNWLGGGGLSSVQRDYIAEEISYQSKRKEAYEQMKKDIERRRKYEGDTADVAMQTYINEATHAADLERNAAYWDRIYKTLNDKVSAYIQSHAGILDVLHGSQWHDLTDQEQTEIAKNTNDKSFENTVKGLQEATKQRKTARSDALDARVNADILAGYMNPDELTTYRTDKAKRDYENTTSGLGSQETTSVIKAKDEAKRIELEAQLSALNEKYSRLEVQYGKAVAAQPSILAELNNSIEAKQAEIKKLTNKDDIEAENEELARMKTLYQQTGETGTQAMRDIDKALKDTDTDIKKTSQDLKEIEEKRLMAIKEETADVFTQLIVEGRSLHDVLKQIVADLAKMAIRQSLGLGGGGILQTIVRGAAKGGSIDGYASGGAVRGAGTGRSDSILAYLANKDKFVYLSNGEYVMTEEATKRIGVDNLDALNGYADGGALSPTPYVASINPVTAKKATSISGDSDTVALLKEQNAQMAEQLTLLKGMDKDGSYGDLVVLNTQVSSADVLKAVQENPRAFQALMGQQRRAGFR